MLKNIKLYFTDRTYYEQRKLYLKCLKTVRKNMKKQIKNFSPWSGYYMHEMVKTMLEFYHQVYLSGNCCWSEESRREEIATVLGTAVHWAKELERLEDLENEELIEIAQKDTAFTEYVASWEAKVDFKVNESNYMDLLLASLAEEYLNEKYTKAMYKIIGEHIWEWCD